MASKPQLAMYASILRVFPDALYDHKIADMEVDVYIPEIFTIVEYDGFPYHAGVQRAQKDIQKSKRLSAKGYIVLRIREENLLLLDGINQIRASGNNGEMALLWLAMNGNLSHRHCEHINQAVFTEPLKGAHTLSYVETTLHTTNSIVKDPMVIEEDKIIRYLQQNLRKHATIDNYKVQNNEVMFARPIWIETYCTENRIRKNEASAALNRLVDRGIARGYHQTIRFNGKVKKSLILIVSRLEEAYGIPRGHWTSYDK